MKVLEFPRKDTHNLVKGYTSRLDAQNLVVEESVFLAEQAGAKLMLEMQKYLLTLQNFIKEATAEDILEFLKERGRAHNLDIIGEGSIAFQYELWEFA
jgi:hypothetical protein